MPPTITAGMTKWDANDLADLTEMKRRNSPRRMSGAKPAKRLAQWERYQGRRGGKGWRNTSSGVVVYQDKMPGDNQGGAAEQPKGGKPPSGKAQPDQAGAAAPQPAQAQPAQAAQPAAAPQAQQAAQPAAQQAAQPQDDLQSPEIDAGDVEQVEQAAPTAGEKVTPPPPGEFYHPDPAKGEAARVGVPGDSAPPPPNKIPRLPNLTDDERAVEEAFASAYERDPAAVAGAFLKGVYESNTPKVFETDAAKCLSPVWMQPGKSEDDRKKARSLYNTALHQTANAIAKRAFLQHLDKIAATKPEGQRHILVTAGGCGAGKGYALANVKEVGSLQDATDGIWDSAGDQNSTEMEWLYKHAKQRGIKATFVYVHNDPMSIWGNPKMGVVQRAKAQGRMVDARVFADSHTHGARNFQKFAEKAGKDPNVSIVYLDNSNPSGPSQVPSIPQSAIEMDPESLYVQAMSYLQQADVPEHVKRGGMVSARLWPSGGNPNVKSKPTKPKAAKAVSSPGSFGAGTATPAATATAAA